MAFLINVHHFFWPELKLGDLDLTPAFMDAIASNANLRTKGNKLDAFNEPALRAASTNDIFKSLSIYVSEACKVSTDLKLGFDLTEVRPEDLLQLASQRNKNHAG